jgi:sulfhydrogenase subunit alpha
MSTTIRIEHLGRVEGHGGVTAVLDGDSVSEVRFDVLEGARLVEALVRGRRFEDVSQTLSRICAICSVAHSLTSIKATERAFDVQVTPQTELLRDLMFRGENIESHALHVFLLALPDYLGYPSATAMAGDHGDAVRMALRLKQLGNSIQETIGGRAVHPVNAVVGGFGRLPSVDQLITLRRDLVAGISDCRLAIDLLATLPAADLCHAETVYAALAAPADYGYYLGSEITVVANGTWTTIPVEDYLSFSNEKAVPHSHAKHSSFGGRPFMVGALARLTINQARLGARSAEIMKKLGLVLPSANPMDNNKAQAVELEADIHRALEIVERLLDDGIGEEPPVAVRPRAGTGTAVTEAPRGLLIHSYRYDNEGKVVSADVITPTALNAASIEHHLRRSIEQAQDRRTAELTRRLEMIVRAYDPCISCSVHLVRKRHEE